MTKMIKNWNPDHMYEYGINMYVCISPSIYLYILPVKGLGTTSHLIVFLYFYYFYIVDT